MPRGVPVATVAIGNAANAGLLAVRILAGWYYVDGDSSENNIEPNFNSWTLDTYGPIHS